MYQAVPLFTRELKLLRKGETLDTRLASSMVRCRNLRFGPVDWVVVCPCMLGYGGFIGKLPSLIEKPLSQAKESHVPSSV